MRYMNNRKSSIIKIIKNISGGSADSETSCIRVSGKDASNFLQGQLSNDIEALNNNTYQISSFLTNQGKVIALVRIFKTNDGYLILLNKEIAKYFIEKISMYILNSDVTITLMDDFAVFGIIEDISEKILEDLKINMPYKFAQPSDDGIWILNNSSKEYKSIILISEKSLDSNQFSKKFNFKESSENILKLTDMLEKFLRLDEKNKERYIPQILNADELNGISFSKGCYTGQEIVARTHYLGKVKKKIFLINSEKNLLEINDKIYNKDNELLGEIISKSILVNNLFYSLGIIKVGSENNMLISKNIPLTIIH